MFCKCSYIIERGGEAMRPVGGPVSMSQEEAEILAIRALGFVADDDNRLARLIALTGLSADDLRQRATDPDFLGALLDFLLEDERMLMDFVARTGIRPEAPYAARRRFPGAPIDG
jgi:hypothetical protein